MGLGTTVLYEEAYWSGDYRMMPKDWCAFLLRLYVIVISARKRSLFYRWNYGDYTCGAGRLEEGFSGSCR